MPVVLASPLGEFAAGIGFVAFALEIPATSLQHVDSFLGVVLPIEYTVYAHLFVIVFDIVFTRDVCKSGQHAYLVVALCQTLNQQPSLFLVQLCQIANIL